jgi:hypothetical protein
MSTFAMQHVDDLITAERRVVHCFEEVALLHFECLNAIDFSSRRVVILEARIAEFRTTMASIHNPLESPSVLAEHAKILGDIYFLNGDDFGIQEGCIQKWRRVLDDLNSLVNGTFKPHGRMYLPSGDE